MFLGYDQAMADYELFFDRYPYLKNPSDINCKEKFDFAMEIGWERFTEMQAARKAGLPFTRR